VDLYHNVLRGDLDAAIIVQPRFAVPKTCSWMTLRIEPLVVLTPVDMPAEDPLTLLIREPFIRYDRNNWGGQIVDHYLRQAGIRPREHLELSAIDAIAAMVGRGLGVSLVPDWASPWPIEKLIAKLPLPDQTHMLRIGLLTANMSPSARLAHLLREEARLTVQDPMPASPLVPD
jgi:DNA-binding transcriptional LysR family regulator